MLFYACAVMWDGKEFPTGSRWQPCTTAPGLGRPGGARKTAHISVSDHRWSTPAHFPSSGSRPGTNSELSAWREWPAKHKTKSRDWLSLKSPTSPQHLAEVKQRKHKNISAHGDDALCEKLKTTNWHESCFVSSPIKNVNPTLKTTLIRSGCDTFK